MDREEAHRLVDKIYDLAEKEKVANNAPDQEATPPSEPAAPAAEAQKAEAAPQKPKDQRVVRTKSSGDRVYLLNDGKDPKTRQWVYNPEVLESLGFSFSDVQEIEDSELLKYSMGPAILKPVEKPNGSPQA